MTPKTRRLIGMLFMIAAAVFFVLNLKRVANMGTYSIAVPLLVIGVALVASSKRGR